MHANARGTGLTAVASDPATEPERPRRRAVLDVLRTTGSPLGVGEVAEQLGVHPNTVRFHLDALVERGLVDRTVEEPSGPGRPRTVYAPRPGMDRSGARSYRLLSRMLLSHLATGGPDSSAAVTETGRVWGRYLVDQVPPFHRVSVREAVRRLTTLLAELGFDPEPDGDPELDCIRLRHCPFLELAEEYAPIVCPLHLGLMQGALAELRAPLTASGLEPFAEPDTCLARLTALGIT